MARAGSLDGSLATLDLSEASDRVSNVLVETMLENHPHLAEAIDACRSRYALVGDTTVYLHKFASMGSALTFPIEAMVFMTVVLIGITRARRTPPTRMLHKELKGKVRVYGDDIIVPADCVDSVIRALETFGFKVNEHKSFWNGQFRESCGKEYFAGQDVSIVKVRQDLPNTRKDVSQIVSTVSTRNQFYGLGMWRTARFLDEMLAPCLGFNYPLVDETSAVLGRVSVPFGYETQRMHPHTHSPLVRGFVVHSQSPINRAIGVSALHKVLLSKARASSEDGVLASDLPVADEKHLERSGRPEYVDIKLRWSSPF
jgi:hypothetical protein